MYRILIRTLIFCSILGINSSKSWADIQVQGFLNNAALENLAADPTCAPATTCPTGRMYYNTTAGEPRMWDGGAWQQVLIGASVVPDPLLLGDGLTGAPTYSFSADGTTGVWHDGSQVRISSDSNNSFGVGIDVIESDVNHNFGGGAVQIDSGDGIRINTSSVVDDVEIEFTGTESANIYATQTAGQDLFVAADDLVYLRPGNSSTSQTIFSPNGQIEAELGSVASPTYTFDGDEDSGFYRKATNTSGVAQSLVLDSNAVGYGGTEVSSSRLDINLNANTFDAIGLISNGMNTTSQFTPALYLGTKDSDLSCPTEKGCPLVAIVGEAENTYSGTVGRMSFNVLTKGTFTANNDAYVRALRITSNGQMRVQPGSAGEPTYSFASNTDTGMYLTGGSNVGITLDGDVHAGFEADGTYLYKQAGSVGGDNISACWSNTSAGTYKIGECSSSLRFKEEIEDLPDSVSEKIYDLRPVKFRGKTQNKLLDYGFIAEEVKDHIPVLVSTSEDENGQTQYDGVSYSHMTALLVQEMKKLKARIEELEAGN